MEKPIVQERKKSVALSILSHMIWMAFMLITFRHHEDCLFVTNVNTHTHTHKSTHTAALLPVMLCLDMYSQYISKFNSVLITSHVFTHFKFSNRFFDVGNGLRFKLHFSSFMSLAVKRDFVRNSPSFGVIFSFL